MRSTIKFASFAAPVALALALGACGDDDDVIGGTPTPSPTATTPAPSPTPTGSPTPTPTATTANFDVTRCLTQMVPGTGKQVAELVVPDTLTLNLGAASGFPNGRLLTDPVIDVTLAVIFLDLTTHSPLTLANIPINPPRNDRNFRGFPFLAPPQGSPPLANGGGSGFTFRNDADSAYVRVDRMGMPAVATALIGSDQKVPYNDANPSDDAAGTFVPELTEQLTGLTNALADDLTAAGLTPCAQPAT